MSKRNEFILGNSVVLVEVNPNYFEKIIEWRNNSDFNKYLNQPYKLTMELQQHWYEKYINDYSQGLFLAIDKNNNQAFATIGYTDYCPSEKICISGRLLVGELEYRGSEEWKEAVSLFNEYLYNRLGVNIVYSHIVIENIASIKWHKKWGFIESKNIRFEEELLVNGMIQREYFRDIGMYQKLFL